MNLKERTNDLFAKFTYVSEFKDSSPDDSGKGFFYDGRIDLDKDGTADGEQIANGLPFPSANSIINLEEISNYSEFNFIPIQVLDYACNEMQNDNTMQDYVPPRLT